MRLKEAAQACHARKEWKEAYCLCLQLIEQTCADAEVYYLAAHAALQFMEEKEVLPLIKHAVVLSPQDRRYITSLRHLASSMKAYDEHAFALQMELSHPEGSDWPCAQEYLDLLLKREEYQSALVFTDQVLEGQPGFWSASLYRGRLLFLMGSPEAEHYLRSMDVANAEDEELNELLCRLYIAKGDVSSALFYWGRLQSEYLRNVLTGLMKEGYREWNKAEACYQQALTIDAAQPEIHCALGNLFLRRGRGKEYYELAFLGALDRDAFYLPALRALTEIYFDRGEWDLGKSFLDSAIWVAPHGPANGLLLYRYCQQIRDAVAAREALPKIDRLHVVWQHSGFVYA